MKNLVFISMILCSFLSYSQTTSLPWEEDYQFEALLDQADGGSVSIDITNTGADINECIKKAKSQALFTIIFKGYPKTNSASASTALADMANYNQNIDFYKNYLSSNTGGLAHVNKYNTNTSKPAYKVNKKTINSTTTVYILKAKLREDLQALGYIKSAAKIAEEGGIAPSILIIPSDMWMKNAGYAKSDMTDKGEVWSYDYQNAISDPKMAIFGSIEGFLKPTLQKNGFRILTLGDIMAKLSKANTENLNRSKKTQEDPQDILAKVAQADIWLKVNLIQEPLPGKQLQYQLTLNGIDPLLFESRINGTPQTIKSAENNILKQVETTVNASIDNLLPEITTFFVNREKNGLPGKVEFLLSEELESFNFDSELDVDGETYSFADVIDGMVSKQSTKYLPSGEQTGAFRSYDIVIPFKTENKLSGKVEMNTYAKFAAKVNKEISSLIKDQKITAIIENKGLGRVVVVFSPKKP